MLPAPPGRRGRANLALICPVCTALIYASRRTQIDAGQRDVDHIGHLLVGRRGLGPPAGRGERGQPRASVEVLYPRAADLPDQVRDWFRRRLLGAIRQGIEWGLISGDDLADYAGGQAVAPRRVERGPAIRPIHDYSPPPLPPLGTRTERGEDVRW
ncbi:MAG: hypothetical protein H6719_08815 [Sandaracinaceae bacterium]|nr:hypothetical protein [Sandaracinaceae bacterium]